MSRAPSSLPQEIAVDLCDDAKQLTLRATHRSVSFVGAPDERGRASSVFYTASLHPRTSHGGGSLGGRSINHTKHTFDCQWATCDFRHLATAFGRSLQLASAFRRPDHAGQVGIPAKREDEAWNAS